MDFKDFGDAISQITGFFKEMKLKNFPSKSSKRRHSLDSDDRTDLIDKNKKQGQGTLSSFINPKSVKNPNKNKEKEPKKRIDSYFTKGSSDNKVKSTAQPVIKTSANNTSNKGRSTITVMNPKETVWLSELKKSNFQQKKSLKNLISTNTNDSKVLTGKGSKLDQFKYNPSNNDSGDTKLICKSLILPQSSENWLMCTDTDIRISNIINAHVIGK